MTLTSFSFFFFSRFGQQLEILIEAEEAETADTRDLTNRKTFKFPVRTFGRSIKNVTTTYSSRAELLSMRSRRFSPNITYRIFHYEGLEAGYPCFYLESNDEDCSNRLNLTSKHISGLKVRKKLLLPAFPFFLELLLIFDFHSFLGLFTS